MTRSTKTSPNCTTARCHFSLPIESCNNVLTNHASSTANSSLVCFSCGWFLGHIRHARVPGWLQMALVAVNKQALGCKPHMTAAANWCYPSIWLLFMVIGPLLGLFWTVSYWCVFSLPLRGSPPPPTNHSIEITCGFGEITIYNGGQFG